MLSGSVRLDIHQQVGRRILHHAQLAVRHEILCKSLFFIRLQPREVGLVVGIHTRHQFDVRTVLVGQVAVPRQSEIPVAPRPLLLTRRDMVIGHVQHARTGIVLVTADEIVFRLDRHIGGRHGNILVTRNIDSGRIIHLVVYARSNGIFRHVALAVVENGVHIARKHRLIVVVDRHGGICPPEEGLRHGGRVVELALDFEHGASGTKHEPGHAFLVEHPFAFAHPHHGGAVRPAFDAEIDRQESARTVVLRPVEFDAARNPRPGQSDQRGFYHMVVVDEMALLDFVISHLHPTAQFGQDHDFEILVLKEYGVIGFVFAGILDLLDHRIRIYDSAASLINPFFEEHRILFRLPDTVGGQQDILLPYINFTHVCN